MLLNVDIINKEKSNVMLTIGIYILMAVYAVSITMLGPLIPVVIKYYGISISQGGLVVSFQNIGGIMAALLGVLLADRINNMVLIAVAFAVYSISLFFVSISPVYILLLLTFFVLGVGTKIVDLITNVVIADLHFEKRGFFLNLLHGCFAVGALSGPLFSQLLLDNNMHWSNVFKILGGICIAVFIIYLAMLKIFTPVYKNPIQRTPMDFSSIIKKPAMWRLCLVIIMYCAHQSGIITWWFMYMEDHIGVSKITSSYSLSIFWVGIIMGRFICSYIVKHAKPRTIIIWGNLLGGIVLTVSIILEIPAVLIAAIGLTGFLTGAVIPLIYTIACGWYPESSGTATSIIFLSVIASSVFFPWFIGLLMENAGFQRGIIITGVTLLGGFLAALSVPSESV